MVGTTPTGSQSAAQKWDPRNLPTRAGVLTLALAFKLDSQLVKATRKLAESANQAASMLGLFAQQQQSPLLQWYRDHMPEMDPLLELKRDLDSEWTVEEDALLVECQELDPQVSWDEFAAVYRFAQGHFPKGFPKDSLHCAANIFSQRFEQLTTSDAGRHDLLLRCLQDLWNRREGKRKAAVAPIAEFIGHHDVKRQLTLSDLANAADFGHEKVRITLQGRAFNSTSIVTFRAPLAQHSDVVSAWLEKNRALHAQQSELDNGGDVIPTLTLSELSDEDRHIDTFNYLNPDTFRKFLLFLRNSDIVSARADLKAKHEATQTRHEADLKEVTSGLQAEMQTKIRALGALQEQEMVEKEREMDRQFWEDVRMLEHQHKLEVELERERIRERYRREEQYLESHFQLELAKMRALRQRIDQEEIHDVHKRLLEANKTIEVLLHKNELLQQLILSESLQVERLREACVALVSENVGRYARMEAMGCRKIREETLMAILAASPTSDLIELNLDRQHVLIDASYIQREINYRKRIERDRLKNLTLAELLQERESMEALSFPHLLRLELERRRTEKEITSGLDQELAPRSVLVDPQRHSVTTTAAIVQRYACVHSRPRASRGLFGRWVFEVTVTELHGLGSSISVGWDCERVAMDGAIVGLHAGPDPGGRFGLAWQSEGYLYGDGQSRYAKLGIEAGDTIAVTLDFERNVAAFWRQGRAVELRVEKDRDLVETLSEFPISPDIDVLVPAVSLYAAHASSPVQAVFNLTGPFENALDGYYPVALTAEV